MWSCLQVERSVRHRKYITDADRDAYTLEVYPSAHQLGRRIPVQRGHTRWCLLHLPHIKDRM